MTPLTRKIDAIPMSKERFILRELDSHWGLQNAISRNDLNEKLNNDHKFYHFEDRDTRRRIEDLRNQGWPICSWPGKPHGYYFDIDKVKDFVSRGDNQAKKIFKRDHAMLRAAEVGKFNPEQGRF